jgi:hypothetical protein
MIPFRLYIYGGVVAAILVVITAVYFKGRSDGYSSYEAAAAKQLKEKADAASTADDNARRCASDPSCRLSNDGFRRD